MFITLPLALIGAAFMIYLLFAAATYVVPLYAGLAAAFAALHAGASYITAAVLSSIAFLIVILVGQVAMCLPSSRPLRVAVMLLFALPASVASFQVASVLLQLSGAGGWGRAVALAAALATGVVTVRRRHPLAEV